MFPWIVRGRLGVLFLAALPMPSILSFCSPVSSVFLASSVFLSGVLPPEVGGRIAHGLLVLSVASGLSTRLPVLHALQPSLLGMTHVTCRWLAPTRIGDTVRVELTFTAAQLTRSGTKGRVTERRLVLNQDDVAVIDSEWMSRWPCARSPQPS